MDTRERFGPPPFSRDPRSLPLYVPPERSLPLWPRAWGLWPTLRTFAAGVAFFAALFAVLGLIWGP